MQAYQKQFIEFLMQLKALKFGEFTLKSGRKSPYFFDAGLFNSGMSLARLGKFYAEAIINAQIDFDMLFGPAYKGIPLVSATAIALADHHNQDIPYAFNRKEAKDHGEGGIIVGSPLQNKVLLIDDVITAGTAIRASMPLFEESGAELAGIIITLDRQERGKGEKSAIQELQEAYNIPVISIIKLEHIIEYLQQEQESSELLTLIANYRQEYGVA